VNEEHGEDIADVLKQDALESMGHFRRLIADRLRLPEAPLVRDYSRENSDSVFHRGHRLAVTALALSADDRRVYSVSKDGSILEFDVESGAKNRFELPKDQMPKASQVGAPWMAPSARKGSKAALLAAAVSSDGRYLAVGGGSKMIDIWDARSRTYVRSLPGHKDSITALAFREGTHQLFSGSFDRSLKIWSLEDMTYIDTLFGHQSEILGLDALRADRALSCGADRTCRVWKIPEESQLVFRGHTLNIESCAYITSSEWVTGDADGSVQLWNSAKKKPTFSCKMAHISDCIPSDSSEFSGAGSIGGNACGWVGSISVCPGSDLIASGAGDGQIKFWKVWDGGRGDGGRRALQNIGAIPVRGFINSIAIAKSAKFIAAGVGQEPRLGRWLRDPAARNGILIHPLDLRQEDGLAEEDDDA